MGVAITIDGLMETLGEDRFLALGGLLIGTLFGILAQRSRFCLRASTLEVAHGRLGERLAVWLLAFSTALIATQGLILLGLFDTGSVRQLNNPGSLSGAVIGGLMFGCGMTLTRACASRMLVLAATGNLRALLSGLVFAVVAQAALRGVLSPAREAINGWWTVGSAQRDLLALAGVGHDGALLFALGWLAAGAMIARRNRLSGWSWLGAAGVGLTVAAAWWFTWRSAAAAFEPVAIHSLSFTAPSADFLMLVLSPPGATWGFDTGLIPGVALGAFLAGLAGRDLKLEGFSDGSTMRRYIVGGCLMGFGSVLAGGCAIGAGVSGASIFVLTAWLVLWSMWIGAVLTDRAIDRKTGRPARARSADAPAIPPVAAQ
ncbi:lipocalin [Azospirillum thiophilum]|uniref:Lipocalin n=1 Tax=Azospirillum thiophilum TaxID=528244 RepID=A0AAC8W4A3_9PROT|nr:YeeE/YedE family protein [Azospirillum thiophilum]ALG74789.1 lipocalin [Azospirillum thiophilum]KJR61613.1 lipocalin [Azospirillum thiophilum]